MYLRVFTLQLLSGGIGLFVFGGNQNIELPMKLPFCKKNEENRILQTKLCVLTHNLFVREIR